MLNIYLWIVHLYTIIGVVASKNTHICSAPVNRRLIRCGFNVLNKIAYQKLFRDFQRRQPFKQRNVSCAYFTKVNWSMVWNARFACNKYLITNDNTLTNVTTFKSMSCKLTLKIIERYPFGIFKSWKSIQSSICNMNKWIFKQFSGLNNKIGGFYYIFCVIFGFHGMRYRMKFSYLQIFKIEELFDSDESFSLNRRYLVHLFGLRSVRLLYFFQSSWPLLL